VKKASDLANSEEFLRRVLTLIVEHEGITQEQIFNALCEQGEICTQEELEQALQNLRDRGYTESVPVQ